MSQNCGCFFLIPLRSQYIYLWIYCALDQLIFSVIWEIQLKQIKACQSMSKNCGRFILPIGLSFDSLQVFLYFLFPLDQLILRIVECPRLWRITKNSCFFDSNYCISSYSFRGNYSFLTLALCTVTFDLST